MTRLVGQGLRIVRVRVANEVLRLALGFPGNSKIVTIVKVPRADLKTDVELWIECPDLPELEEGKVVPAVMPTIRTGDPPELIDWGIGLSNPKAVVRPGPGAELAYAAAQALGEMREAGAVEGPAYDRLRSLLMIRGVPIPKSRPQNEAPEGLL